MRSVRRWNGSTAACPSTGPYGDVSFGFERHFIRGQAKMRLRVGLALVVMLAMALGRVKEKQKEKMRSLVQAA